MEILNWHVFKEQNFWYIRELACFVLNSHLLLFELTSSSAEVMTACHYRRWKTTYCVWAMARFWKAFESVYLRIKMKRFINMTYCRLCDLGVSTNGILQRWTKKVILPQTSHEWSLPWPTTNKTASNNILTHLIGARQFLSTWRKRSFTKLSKASLLNLALLTIALTSISLALTLPRAPNWICTK